MRAKEEYQLELTPGANGPLVRRIIDESFARLPDTNTSKWSLDLRVPLSKGALLQPLVLEMRRMLAKRGLSQIAGAGFGSSFLIGGIVASAKGIRGGLIRDSRKTYGFRRMVEGDLDRDVPIFLVDDILASGRSAINAAAVLRAEGFSPIGLLTILRYAWAHGEENLTNAGLLVESLATLHPLFA